MSELVSEQKEAQSEKTQEKVKLRPEEIKKIGQRAFEEMLQRPIPVVIEVKHPTFFHKIGILKKRRSFELSLIGLGFAIRISEILSRMDKECLPKLGEKIDESSLVYSGIRAIAANGKHLVEVIALALHNGRDDPGSAGEDEPAGPVLCKNRRRLIRGCKGKQRENRSGVFCYIRGDSTENSCEWRQELNR